MVYSLEALAGVSAALGKIESAAQIWGASERQREDLGAPLPSNERPRYDRRVAEARASIPEEAAFGRGWQIGRNMSLEQAVDLALNDP